MKLEVDRIDDVSHMVYWPLAFPLLSQERKFQRTANVEIKIMEVVKYISFLGLKITKCQFGDTPVFPVS